ncbi:MAG: Rec domain CheY [Candidatus Methanohalarchaeum thermophilum]|uniref:Rec domain CheY n=1 Tax=Methanohalarchaeum thermophilum TaxID=1903181 RepID=A0A1Q6DUM0_METT1|nr:MAG: Rec domain CheY [Candidatus Methanohalarchaeum thermophilum]
MMSGTEKKLMVVEDDPDERELYRQILKDEYDVTKAAGGEEALEEIDSSYDLILLDRKMPDLHGDKVLKKIRNNSRTAQIPVIMLTALDANLDIIDMEFDDYINKPVSADDLRDIVKKTLSYTRYNKVLDRYFSLINKKEALVGSLNQSKLEGSDEYQELQEEIEETRRELDQELDKIMEDIPVEDLSGFEKFLENLL